MAPSPTEQEEQCGRFQFLQVVFIQSCRLVAMWALSLMIFGLYDPGWRCVMSNSTTSNASLPTNESAIYSREFHLGNDSPVTPYHIDFHSTQRDDILESKDENNTLEEQGIHYYNGTCDIIASCDSIEFDPRSSTIISEFGLVCDDVWKSRLIVSVLNCGMLIGAFVWGQLGEKFGRKVSLYAGDVVLTIACALAVLSPVWEVYACFIFFIGFGTVGVITFVNILVMEFLNSKWRPVVASLPVTNLGFLLFAVVTFFLRNWKYIHLSAAFACFLSCMGFFWVPESLRWLVVHGKTKRVDKTIKKISKLNKVPLQSPDTTSSLVNDGNNEQKESKTYTYLDLFKTSDIRSLTIRLAILWSISIITYEIIGYGIQSLPGDFYVNIIITSSIEIPCVLLVGPLAIKLGRRRTGIGFAAVGILCSAAIVSSLLAMDKNDLRDVMVTGFAILNKLTILSIGSLMVAFGAELIPTAVRSLAFGVFNMATRVTGMAGSYIIPKDYISMVICFSILMALQIVNAFIIFSLPETKGKPLRDQIKQKQQVIEVEGSETEEL